MPIDTDRFSASLRRKGVELDSRRLLIARLEGSEQEQDITEPVNCGGFGRIRHFRLSRGGRWPRNPLPIDPAHRALGKQSQDEIRAQVFQNAICNWRCWYCYVPFDLLSGNRESSKMFSAAELVDMYLAEPCRPWILDLSGGQPDLVPEWVPWTMQALLNRGVEDDVFLWSDDNLSNDYFWLFLNERDIDLVANYPNYGRVCCFKGFDSASFAFNTRADPSLFDRQFDLMSRLLALRLDLYAYVTFTSPTRSQLPYAVSRFVDRLQQLAHYLPLRTVPLQVEIFTPVHARLDAESRDALTIQHVALDAWETELERRFSAEERAMPLVDIPLYSGLGR